MSRQPFARIKDHVLLPLADRLARVDEALAQQLTPAVLAGIVDAIPDGWLDATAPFADPAAQRDAYRDYLTRRLEAPRAFVEEAIRAR